MLKNLTGIGFKKVGQWSLSNDELSLVIESEENSTNILYCFTVDGVPKYIGKTIQPLKKRMYGYCKPSKSQSTNTRNNSRIKNCLITGNSVELYALPDNGLLHFGQFHLNLAAGLEDSIIAMVNPEWNSIGK